MTAAIAAQVAFWREIPIVHLQAGMASDDLLCPFPQEANRRIIGQLASLFLTTGGMALGGQLGPNAIPVGDTMAAQPQPADLHFARMLRRARADGPRIVMVALDRLDSLGVLAGLPELLDSEPGVEVVLFGELGAHGAAAPIASHPRGTVVRNVPLADLVALLAVSAVLVTDNPELVADAPGFGTPAVLVDGPYVAELGDSIRSILSPRVIDAVRQLLALHQIPPAPSDGLEALRVEQAVAWMFGLANSPLLDLPQPRVPTDDPAEAPDPAHREP